ncbi:MAG: hypothetical protein J5574_01095, partial [Lachnospiraceae bacterium]|nr:hypothetical protein [Lachnospiraceae bacterium]
MSDIDKYCSLCGRSTEDVGTLTPISEGIRVCGSCLSNAMRVAQQLTDLTRNSDNLSMFNPF